MDSLMVAAFKRPFMAKLSSCDLMSLHTDNVRVRKRTSTEHQKEKKQNRSDFSGCTGE